MNAFFLHACNTSSRVKERPNMTICSVIISGVLCIDFIIMRAIRLCNYNCIGFSPYQPLLLGFVRPKCAAQTTDFIHMYKLYGRMFEYKPTMGADWQSRKSRTSAGTMNLIYSFIWTERGSAMCCLLWDSFVICPLLFDQLRFHQLLIWLPNYWWLFSMVGSKRANTALFALRGVPMPEQIQTLTSRILHQSWHDRCPKRWFVDQHNASCQLCFLSYSP